MKRDPELNRKLLLAIRDAPRGERENLGPPEGYSFKEAQEHLVLLADEGLIEGRPLKTLQAQRYLPTRITAEGHAYLERTKPLTRAERFRRGCRQAIKPIGLLLAGAGIKEFFDWLFN